LPPLTRFDGIELLASFGPMSHFLDQRTEVTYGYGPLKLSRYADFVTAMQSNPALRKDLNVSRWLEPTGVVHILPDPLPRANFPKTVTPVNEADIKQRLATLDPSHQALVPAGTWVAAQDPNGVAEVREFTPGHYRIHYQCSTPSLLRVGNAYFPGWTASRTARSGNQPLPVLPVDRALIGVMVPAGQSDLVLDYHSTYLLPAALTTLASLLLCAGLLIYSRRPAISQ
jgi:hypothetical protein